jgi:hypothetical protein
MRLPCTFGYDPEVAPYLNMNMAGGPRPSSITGATTYLIVVVFFAALALPSNIFASPTL